MLPKERAQQNQAQSASQRALSIQEFAQRYGVGRTTIYEEIKSGKLRARKMGKRTLIAVDDAENWLKCLPFIESQNEH